MPSSRKEAPRIRVPEGKKGIPSSGKGCQLPERDVSCQQNLKRCDAYMAECGDERSVGSRRTS